MGPHAQVRKWTEVGHTVPSNVIHECLKRILPPRYSSRVKLKYTNRLKYNPLANGGATFLMNQFPLNIFFAKACC